MALDAVQRAAVTESVHSGTARGRGLTMRRGAVVTVDPTNRAAEVSVSGPDPTPFQCDVAGGVQLWPGDVVDVLFVPPHGAVVIGRVQGDYEDWHMVGDEGEPEYGTNWAADNTTGPPSFPGPAQPMFTRRSGRVELRGRAERSSGTAQTVFVLPEPYWPDNDLLVPALTNLGAHEPLTISRAGEVRVSTTSINYLVMDGVSFLARAPRDLEA